MLKLFENQSGRALLSAFSKATTAHDCVMKEYEKSIQKEEERKNTERQNVANLMQFLPIYAENEKGEMEALDVDKFFHLREQYGLDKATEKGFEK